MDIQGEKVAEIVGLWTSGASGVSDRRTEALEKFEALVYEDGESLTSVLAFAFNNGLHDLLDEVKDKCRFSIHDRTIEHATGLNDGVLIDKVKHHMTLHKITYRFPRPRGVDQRDGIEDIINGARETIGNIKDFHDGYQNHYCNQVCVIINSHFNEVWDKLNTQYWNEPMYNFFYNWACVSQNSHVVQKIESAGVPLRGVYRALNFASFKKLGELNEFIIRAKKGAEEERNSFANYLFNLIYFHHRDYFELIDLFIDSFGLDHRKASIKNSCEQEIEFIEKRYLDKKTKKFIFHFISRGLEPSILVENSQCLRKWITSVDDLEFLLRNGLKNVEPIRKQLPSLFVDENLFILAAHLNFETEKYFTPEDSRRVQQQLGSHKHLLRQYVFPEELIQIILAYFYKINSVKTNSLEMFGQQKIFIHKNVHGHRESK